VEIKKWSMGGTSHNVINMKYHPKFCSKVRDFGIGVNEYEMFINIWKFDYFKEVRKWQR
jgi:uncharacterized protein YebE (UPF0316 family)